ncbi:PLAC8 protein, partial [Amia calva]|nr:PLAC8 protein [Amia calva]
MAAPRIMMSQPQSVVVQQVTSVQRSNKWTTGICNCCDDMGICCYGLFCLPCLECQTASEMGECCCLPCLCPGIAPVAMRTGIRERYGIPGSILVDAIALCFCHCCVFCQMAREIKNRGKPVNVQTTTTAYAAVPQY